MVPVDDLQQRDASVLLVLEGHDEQQLVMLLLLGACFDKVRFVTTIAFISLLAEFLYVFLGHVKHVFCLLCFVLPVSGRKNALRAAPILLFLTSLRERTTTTTKC